MCQLSSVPFHGDTIFCVDFHGEPFVPMRPIVENLCLQWGAQAAKFGANKERWGVSIIATLPMVAISKCSASHSASWLHGLPA